MLRRLHCIAASVLACSCVSAQAEVETWAFKFEPFHYKVIASDDDFEGIGYSIEGTFSAEDRDLDGVLELPELLSLQLDRSFPLTGCPVGDFSECSVRAFSFSPAAGLQFSASSTWQGQGDLYAYQSITTGNYSSYYVSNGDWVFHQETLRWIPETRLTMTRLAPVPEPAAGLMLAAGLGLLGLQAARRRNGR